MAWPYRRVALLFALAIIVHALAHPRELPPQWGHWIEKTFFFGERVLIVLALVIVSYARPGGPWHLTARMVLGSAAVSIAFMLCFRMPSYEKDPWWYDCGPNYVVGDAPYALLLATAVAAAIVALLPLTAQRRLATP